MLEYSGLKISFWCIAALSGAWNGVGTSLVPDRLKAEMVRALLEIDDGVDYGTAEALVGSLGKIDNDDILLGPLLGIDAILELVE
jgi:hypothetical protein